MRILTEKINLDLNQNGIQATIDLREGDIESRLIIATLRGYGDAFRPDDNVIAIIRAKKPDGTIIYNNCLVEDGKVKFLVTSQYAAVVGNYNACIELIKDGVVLYSPKFSFHVAANELSDSEVESSSEYTELTTALEQALTALELAENLHLIQYVGDLEVPGNSKYLYVLEDSTPYFTMTDFPTTVSCGIIFESTDDTYPLLLFTGMVLKEESYSNPGVIEFGDWGDDPSATGEYTSMFGYDVANEKWVRLHDFDYYGQHELQLNDEIILTDEAQGTGHTPIITDYVIKSTPKYEIPTDTRVVYLYDNSAAVTTVFYRTTQTGSVTYNADDNVIDLDNIPDVLVGNTSTPYVYDELLNKYIPLCDTDDLKQRVAALESEMSDAEGNISSLGQRVDALEAADVVINGEIDDIQDELEFNITITHDLHSGFSPFINQSFADIEDALYQYKNIPIVLIYSYGDSSYKYASGCMYMHSMTHSVKFRFDIGTEDQAHYLTYTLTSDDTLTYSEELLDIKTHVKRLGIVLANNVATSNIAGLDLWNMVDTSETVTLDITYTDGSNNTSYHKSCVATMKHKAVDTEIEASAIFVKNNKLYARYIDILIGAVTGNYEGSYAVTDVIIPWNHVGYGDGLVVENMYLKVKPKTNGGILVDSNGVYVDTAKVQAKLSNTDSAEITVDNKVKVINPVCPVYKHTSGTSVTCNMTYSEVTALYSESGSLLNNVVLPQLINITNLARSTAVAVSKASDSIKFRFEIKTVGSPDAIQSFIVRHNSNDTVEMLSTDTNSGKRSYQHLLTTPDNTIKIATVDKEKDSIKIADDVINKINNSVMIGTASGSVASIVDGADDTAMKSCVVSIDSTDGTSECNLTKDGKNLFDKENVNVLNGYIATDKVIANSNHRCIYIPCKPNTTYTAQKICVAAGSNDRFAIGYCNETPANNVDCYNISSITSSSFIVGNKVNLTITTGAEAKYIIIWVSTATYYSQSIATTQIETGSTATAYEEYISTTYNIEFVDGSTPLTVHDGELNVLTGVLTVNDTTPSTTYQLAPTEVKTLLGINNIFADCGDVDVEYVRDATSIINYILSKIENI